MMHSWKNGRIKDLIESLESGVSVNGEDRIPADNEPAVLKVSAVTYGVFDPTASKPIIKNDLGRAKCNPKAGQIIISRSNTPDLVGASAYIDRNYPARYLPDKLWQTVPKKNVNVEMRWLAYFLASPWARFQLSRLSTGTSSSMKNITKSELLTLPIPIPPLSEQTAIADLLSTWDAAIEKTEKLIAAKEKRFLWLLHSLFNEQTLISNENSGSEKVKLGELFGSQIKVEKGRPLTKDLKIEGDIPVVAGGQSYAYYTSTPTHETPTVTISASGAYAGFVWFHDYPIWASDCNVLYVKNSLGSTKFLFFALKSIQHKVYALQSGGAQPHVYSKDMKNLLI